MRLAGSRLTKDGVLVIIAQSHRTQERNRQDARDRLIELIRQAAVVPVKRRTTKPTKASREKRIESKKRRGNIKGMRQHQAVVRLAGHAKSGDRLPVRPPAARRPPSQRLDWRKSCYEFAHARPPAQRSHRQPHRRRRGGRAAGERGQGAGRERARRRRDQDRDRHRRRRPPADPRHRRRRRHAARRPRARGRAPRHLEAHRRRPARHQDARLPRRGAAVDRLGRAARDHHAPPERAACLDDRGRRRRQIRA